MPRSKSPKGKLAKAKSAKRKSVKARQVWDRPAPKNAKHKHLTPGQKSAAKSSAKRAGRPYPNLVDNLRASKKNAGKTK